MRKTRKIGRNRKEKGDHDLGERNFGGRAEVIKEDFDEEPSVKYILLSSTFWN